MNLYEYGKSNPILLSDPLGNCICISWWHYVKIWLEGPGGPSINPPGVEDILLPPRRPYCYLSKWVTRQRYGETTRYECQKDIADEPCTPLDIGAGRLRNVCGKKTVRRDIWWQEDCKRRLYFSESANATQKWYHCERKAIGVWKWTVVDEYPWGEKIIRVWFETQYRYLIYPGLV